jgi:CrcB protein
VAANGPYQWLEEALVADRVGDAARPLGGSVEVDPQRPDAGVARGLGVGRRSGAGRRRAGTRPDVLAVVAAGGVVGALARDGLSREFPHSPDGFPWATFGINVLGCLLIGALAVGVEQLPAHRLARPFLGVGVLGGFTTFSTQAVEAEQAIAAHAAGLAMLYLGGTLVAALGAAWAGSALAQGVFRAGHRWTRRRERRREPR